MKGATAEREPGRVVLIADDDAFESGYVNAVLAARRIAVIGPFADLPDALRAAETPGLRAAVIAHRGTGAPDGLAEALARRGIPYLTLTRRTRTTVSQDGPILAWPFAAHQVADWVARTLAPHPVVAGPAAQTADDAGGPAV